MKGGIMKQNSFCIVFVVVLIAIIASGTPALSAGVNMQEGNWESTMEIKMEGMPFPMPPMKFTTTQCLTKEDMVPKTAQKDQQCEIKEKKVSGNKVTWKVKCVEKNGTTEGEGEITYSGNSYQ